MYMKSPRHENAQRKLVHFSTKKKKKEKKTQVAVDLTAEDLFLLHAY